MRNFKRRENVAEFLADAVEKTNCRRPELICGSL